MQLTSFGGNSAASGFVNTWDRGKRRNKHTSLSKNSSTWDARYGEVRWRFPLAPWQIQAIVKARQIPESRRGSLCVQRHSLFRRLPRAPHGAPQNSPPPPVTSLLPKNLQPFTLSFKTKKLRSAHCSPWTLQLRWRGHHHRCSDYQRQG